MGGSVSLGEIRQLVRAEEEYECAPGVELRRVEWEFSLRGDEATQAKLEALMRRNREHYADHERFARLSRWRETGQAAPDRLLARQVELLWRDYLGNQGEPQIRDQLVRLQAEQQGLFNRFRASLDGRAWSENDLNDALAETRDRELARRVWEASKQIGRYAEPHAIEMVRLNNRDAQAQGFRDAYERGLVLAEVDEGRLFALLDALERDSDAPFRAAKAELDARLAERFGVPAAELRPWHYGDPFFQRPPRAAEPDLDPYFKEKDPEALANAAIDSIGLDARPILARSDNWPRPGKNQHAFCMSVQPNGSDVRTLNNLTHSYHWTGVLLHELGHALAAEYADRSLPQRLVLWPNGIIAETESQTIDRIANDARWLHEAVGIEADRAEWLADEMRQRARLSQLILTRWSLVQAHFERALHADPEQDLPTLWWDLVERFQLVRRPEGRHEPDWAAKIHNANFPGHYYVYILGELVVSQLSRALAQEVGGLYGHRRAGPFLVDRLYRLGAQYDWEETARRATGAPLSVDAYVAEWFGA
ncbi:MAG TPA: M3 family metallopeptidase [Chloroflexota bacterium]|nr:M3 family metallopeptidase [Chloroflexota bacterium]